MNLKNRMIFENTLIRILNRRAGRRAAKPAEGLYLGQGEALLSGERAPLVLPLTPIQHTFICGRSGSGKTTLLLKILYEHVNRGLPFLFIDFHGHATDELLSILGSTPNSPPVVLVEPWTDPVIGWNQLTTRDESPYAIVQELVSVFHHRLWPDAWGPRLEEVLRMTLLALVEANLTLLEATTFLSRPEFRRAVLRHGSLPEVREFWALRFEQLSPSQRSLIAETALNKLGVFHDPTLRYVIGQQQGALDLDAALSSGHTILCNLSSGRLRGNNYLLASLLVAAFKNAVYRRPPNARPYSVILDEFQEMIALDALDDFLRSFRKFNCAAYLATQHLALSSELKASIFGNCGRFVCFATSATDAAFLGKEFGSSDGELAATLLPELAIGQAVAKIRGQSVKVLRVARSPVKTNVDLIGAGRSRALGLGKTRQVIDQEINRRIRELSAPALEREETEIRFEKANSPDVLPEGYV